jgi:predicted nucleic acid-binding protein
MMETLIFDTSALFNFGHRGELEFLLKKMAAHARLLTTQAVCDECVDPNRKEFYTTLVKTHFAVQSAGSVAIPDDAFRRISAVLGAGEISVLLLAAELKATAILDEKVARREAAALGIKVIGTLGLIADCLTRNWLTEGECLRRIVKMHAAGFRIRKPHANETIVEYFREIVERSGKL